MFSSCSCLEIHGDTNIKKSFVHVFKDGNLLLFLSFVIGMGLQIFVIEVPGVNTVFKVYPLSDAPMDYLYVLLLALSPLIIHEIVALFLFIKKKLAKK